MAASAASCSAARRSSTRRPGPAAGLCWPLGRDGHARRRHRLHHRARRDDVRRQALAPVEAHRDLLRGQRPGSGEGLVEHPNMLLSRSIGSRRSCPSDSNSTGTPARLLRSRVARRRVGTRPRSSRTIGRTSKMNVFVASRVCWTIETSWRTSPAEEAGSVATRRSTICACSTMLVRLWAGPSCIAREIPTGGPPGRSSAPARRRHPSVRRRPRLGQTRGPVDLGQPSMYPATASRYRASARRLPSRTSTCVSMRAARFAAATGRGRLLEAIVDVGAVGQLGQLVGRASSGVLRDGRLGPGLGDEQVDLQLLVERVEIVREPGRDRSIPAQAGCAAVSFAISPRASGSSPGASRTRRPACGR